MTPTEGRSATPKTTGTHTPCSACSALFHDTAEHPLTCENAPAFRVFRSNRVPVARHAHPTNHVSAGQRPAHLIRSLWISACSARPPKSGTRHLTCTYAPLFRSVDNPNPLLPQPFHPHPLRGRVCAPNATPHTRHPGRAGGPRTGTTRSTTNPPQHPTRRTP